MARDAKRIEMHNAFAAAIRAHFDAWSPPTDSVSLARRLAVYLRYLHYPLDEFRFVRYPKHIA